PAPGWYCMDTMEAKYRSNVICSAGCSGIGASLDADDERHAVGIAAVGHPMQLGVVEGVALAGERRQSRALEAERLLGGAFELDRELLVEAGVPAGVDVRLHFAAGRDARDEHAPEPVGADVVAQL